MFVLGNANAVIPPPVRANWRYTCIGQMSNTHGTALRGFHIADIPACRRIWRKSFRSATFDKTREMANHEATRSIQTCTRWDFDRFIRSPLVDFDLAVLMHTSPGESSRTSAS